MTYPKELPTGIIKEVKVGDKLEANTPYFIEIPKEPMEWESEFERVFHGKRLVAPENKNILRNFIITVTKQAEKRERERIVKEIDEKKQLTMMQIPDDKYGGIQEACDKGDISKMVYLFQHKLTEIYNQALEDIKNLINQNNE